MKIKCNKCGEVKELNKFPKDKRCKLGITKICKKCKREGERKNYYRRKSNKKWCPICKKWFLPKENEAEYCERCQRLIDNKKIKMINGKKYYLFICNNCNETYKTDDFRHDQYCSKKCFYEYNKLKPIKCKYCNKEFRPDSSEDKYCSIDCNRKDNPRSCEWCGKEFIGPSNKKYCSDKCSAQYHEAVKVKKEKKKHIDKERKCEECGIDFVVKYGDKRRKYCSEECAEKAYKKTESYKAMRRRQRHKRRMIKKNGKIEKFTYKEIFERDNWTCQICGEKVDSKLEHPHPMSASLDHIVPLSKGGNHTKRNVQLAHMICNSKKGNGSANSQMRLFG